MLNNSRRRFAPTLISDVLLLCTSGKPVAFVCSELDLKPNQVKYIMRKYNKPQDRISELDRLIPARCKWPIGDPKLSDFHFCNKIRAKTFDPVSKREKERPYCAHHMQINLTPLTRRGKRKQG